MAKKEREYIDKDHEVMSVFYDLSEMYNTNSTKSIKRQLKRDN